MLRIRLTRTGKKNQPHFRVVIAEHRKAVKGRYLEILGHYNPRSKEISLNKEKIKEWIKKGAQPSVTMNNLLVREGVLAKEDLIKVTVIKKKTEEEEKEEEKEEAKAKENPSVSSKSSKPSSPPKSSKSS